MTKSSLARPDQMTIRTRYDFMARWHGTAGWFATPHRCQAIQVLDAQPGECVLDLACGTGINFKNIISQLDAADT
jgi:ubiquinone/menaquinone biosynthesis C-methylase UbiE